MRKVVDDGGGRIARQKSVQDRFLNQLRKEKIAATIFLMKGVKLQGIVTWFDNFSILLKRDGRSQLVYKHSISTISPMEQLGADITGKTSSEVGQTRLQDVFLSRATESAIPATIFLMNGVMLEGRLADHDLFCLLFERGGQLQLVYKHAVSTIQPDDELDLFDDGDV